MKFLWLSLASLLLLALAGCGSSQSAEPSSPAPAENTQATTEPAAPQANQPTAPPADAPTSPPATTATPAPQASQPTASSTNTPVAPRATTAAPAPLSGKLTPSPAPAPAAAPPVDKFIALAKNDLAGQLNIDVGQITVQSATPIVWPNAALGCPSPGKVYAQGRVPGFQIVLEAQGTTYTYHTDQTGKLVVCPEPSLDASDPSLPAAPGPTQVNQIGVPIK